MKQNTLPGISRANHSNLGRDFERELETAHDIYRIRGIADIRKIPHVWTFISAKEYLKLKTKLPASMLAQTNDGKFLQRTKSDVDFVGGGRDFHLALDAKSITGKRFPMDKLSPHQLEKLLSRTKCGAVAGLLIKFSDEDRGFFVSADYLRRRSEMLFKAQIGKRIAPRGTASLSLEDLEKHGVEIYRNKRNGVWDYLEIVLNNRFNSSK